MISSPVNTLTQINLDELVSSFGWKDRPFLAGLLRRTLAAPPRIFARQLVEFDSTLSRDGLVEASRRMIRHHVDELRVFGRDCIPQTAFLALSNHPGMADALSLFIALNRTDLKVIVRNRPFLNALPNLSRQLAYIDDDPGLRIRLIRKVSAHLRNDGAALTFPAGRIEPDPDIQKGAVESLGSWADSVGVFIRMAPDTAILPVVVRGVVRKKTANHPLSYLRRHPDDRERFVAALQLLAHVMFKRKDVRVRVQIGRPVYARELGTTETGKIHQAVLTEMKRLIEYLPAGEGERLA